MKKELRIFLLKFFSILMTVLLVVSLLNIAYKKTPYYIDAYGETDKFVKGVPDNIQLANMGSSHGLASFYYENEKQFNCFNFAMSGQSLVSDYAIMRQYKDHLTEKCIVALPVSYFTFTQENPNTSRYYLFLDSQYIEDYKFENTINQKYFPALRNGGIVTVEVAKDSFSKVKKQFQKIKNDQTLTTSSDVSQNKSAIKQYFLQHAQSRKTTWTNSFISNSKNIPGNKQLLLDMIQYCRDNNWLPVLVATPIHETLINSFADGMLDKYYYSIVDEIVKETNIPYLKLDNDKRFTGEMALFDNSDHLSLAGSKVFMEIYMDFLNQLGYIR